MKVRTISLITGSLAMAIAPTALGHRGGDRSSRGGNQPAIAPATPTAAALLVATSIPCNVYTGRRKEFEVRGTVTAIAANGVTVSIEKANRRFVAGAAGATRTGGVYNAAPGTSNIAFVPFGDCTRVSGRRNERRGHGRRDRSATTTTTTPCVSFGGAYDRNARRICVGDRAQITWRAPRGTSVATGLGAPNRIEVKRSR